MLTYKQAAAELGVSDRTMRRLAASKQLTVVRFGTVVRIKEADLEKFIDKKTRKSK